MRISWPALLTLSALTVGATTAQAAEQEIRIGPRVGPGELRINSGEFIGDEQVDELVDENTIGIGGTLEYRAPFGLVIEGGLFNTGSSNFFADKDYRLTQYFGSLGYQFDLGKGFSIIPRVGRERWKLEADALWFFDDDGPNPTARGYQNYWEITALKRIAEKVTLGISHKENDYDFGRGRTTVFTAMFNL